MVLAHVNGHHVGSLIDNGDTICFISLHLVIDTGGQRLPPSIAHGGPERIILGDKSNNYMACASGARIVSNATCGIIVQFPPPYPVVPHWE